MKITVYHEYEDGTCTTEERDILPPTVAQLHRQFLTECTNRYHDLCRVEFRDGGDTLLSCDLTAMVFHGWSF